MNYFLLLALMTISNPNQILFDFKKEASLIDWTTVNDGVMGGVSDSQMIINEDGYAVFSGSVSLDYNGGFASVRYNPKPIDVSKHRELVIRCKGKPNRYQIRTKSSRRERHSYIQYIDIANEWQEISIDMNEMYPQFRGYELDIANYPKEILGEFAILIGNKRYEDFEIIIDWIEIR